MQDNNLKKRKWLRTAIRITALVLVGLIFGFTVYKINAKNLVGDRLPMPLGIGASVVITGSMEPEISINDLIIVKRTDEFYKGQIVVFQSERSLIVHRIDDIQGEDIITKGDANNTQDKPIKADDIKGEVIMVIPFVGAIVGFLQNPIVTVAIIAIALLLIERSYRLEKNANKDELEKIKEEIERLKK